MNILKTLEKSIRSLDIMPERFRRYKHCREDKADIRVMLVKNYLIFYTVDNINNRVEIIRVLYSKMDYQNLLE